MSSIRVGFHNLQIVSLPMENGAYARLVIKMLFVPFSMMISLLSTRHNRQVKFSVVLLLLLAVFNFHVTCDKLTGMFHINTDARVACGQSVCYRVSTIFH